MSRVLLGARWGAARRGPEREGRAPGDPIACGRWLGRRSTSVGSFGRIGRASLGALGEGHRTGGLSVLGFGKDVAVCLECVGVKGVGKESRTGAGGPWGADEP